VAVANVKAKEIAVSALIERAPIASRTARGVAAWAATAASAPVPDRTDRNSADRGVLAI
jgi:hypothetical protein